MGYMFFWPLYPIYWFAKFWIDSGMGIAEFFSCRDLPEIECPVFS
jgi:hypothetical protein